MTRAVVLVCLLLTGSAQAQQISDPVPPQDCRISPAVIELMSAQIAYKQAVINVMAADAKKLAEWWASYTKGAGS